MDNIIISKKLNILILEDSEFDYELIANFLYKSMNDVEFIHAENEEQFVYELINNKFDIILSDFKLPGFDAFNALEIVKKSDDKTPFICVSGSIGEELAVEILKKGATDYVLKDKLNKLPFAIKRAIDEANKKKELEELYIYISENERKYRSLFENVQDVFYQTDLNGIIREISPSISNYNNFNRLKLIGSSVYELYYDVNDRIELLDIIIEKGEIRDYEIRLKSPEDVVIYVSINAKLIKDENEKSKYIEGSFRDITRRKHAEFEILKRESFLNLSQQIANMGSWTLNVKTNEVILSDNNLTILGLLPIYNNKVIEFFIENIYHEDRNNVAAIIENIKIDKTEATFEFRYVMPDSSIKWFYCKSIPVIENNTLLEINGILIDITEEVKNRDELIKLSKAVEQNPVAITITDKTGIIEYVNPKECEVTGYKKEELIGKRPSILRSEFTTDETYIEIKNTLLSGNEWKGELINKKKNNELYWALETISPIFNNKGEIVHLMAVKEDITQQKEIREELLKAKEKAEASNKLKTAFLNNISHEIRTPLNGILGFSQLMLDSEISEDEKNEYFNILDHSCSRLVKTITDIVDSSLILSGNIEAVLNEFNLNEVFENVYQELQGKICNIECILNIPESDCVINSDKYLIKKILQHLIDNSIKFTKQGFIEIGYNLNDNEVLLYVKDSGVGINPENIQKLFEYFMQEDVSNTRGYEGNGLGLTIVDGYVKKLGGEINVESKKGEGSNFTIKLPVNSYSNKFFSNNIQKPINLKIPVILIAEDDDPSYLLVESFFKNKSVRLIRAKDGIEAFELYESNAEIISLILMDIKLPLMNGAETTKKIRSINTSVPIVAVTAYSMLRDEQKIIESGCNEYIEKPINKNVFFSVLKKFGINF